MAVIKLIGGQDVLQCNTVIFVTYIDRKLLRGAGNGASGGQALGNVTQCHMGDGDWVGQGDD